MLNQVQIIGHIGKDPETRSFPSGDQVCNFSIATTERWKDKQTGEQKEVTEWHRISTFGKLAEISAQYLHKGSLVFVQGKLTTRKWTDKDGAEKYSTEIKADTMKMLGSKSESGETPRQATTAKPTSKPASAGSGFDDMDDDIPF